MAPQDLEVSSKQKRRNPSASKREGTLARGLRILEVIAESSTPLTLNEVTQACGLDASSGHRLLQTLVKEKYVLKLEKTKKYLASPKGFFPLSLYHPLNVIRRDAQHMLFSLRDELGDTVGSAIFMSGQRLLLDIAPGRHALSLYYGTWMKTPLHGSASGKVLLMSLSPAERKRLLGPGPYERYTEKTITDPATLFAELEESKKRGFAIARDDAFMGLTALGAPIVIDQSTTIGCFFVVGRSSDYSVGKIRTAGAALKRVAELFSHGTPSLKSLADLLGVASSK